MKKRAPPYKNRSIIGRNKLNGTAKIEVSIIQNIDIMLKTNH